MKVYPDRWSKDPAGKLIDLDRPWEDEPIAEAGKEKRTWREVLGASIARSHSLVASPDRSGMAIAGRLRPFVPMLVAPSATSGAFAATST